MAEQRRPRSQYTAIKQCYRQPAKCHVDIVFAGEDNKAFNAAKEILIASFVKNMINKGNTGDSMLDFRADM